MARTIGDVLKIAEAHKQGKQWLKALKIYRLVLDAVPSDCGVRLDISNMLLLLGKEGFGRATLKETLVYCSRAGYPLQAIIAAKKLAALSPAMAAELYQHIARAYSQEAENRGQTVRVAPLDRGIPVREDIDLDYPIETDTLISSTLQAMTAAAAGAPKPDALPPIPILSDLPNDLFLRTISEVRLRTVPAGEAIVREGEQAARFFIVAKGQVLITKSEGGGRSVELARLGEGSVFGEMALFTESPRSATVRTLEESELLEFDKEKLDALSEESVVFEAALERFTKERLISNLLATNPIFQPFDRRQRYDLLSRFTAHEVTPGTVLVREGQAGRGLYILLFGQADVLKKNNGGSVRLATLRSGDIFGEISLIKDTATTATVTAARHSTVLFLPKEHFERLTASIGDLRAYFDKLSDARLSMMDQALEHARTPGGAEPVSDDERILI